MLVHGDDDARLQAGVVKRAEWPETEIVWVLQTQSRQNAADLESAAPKLQPVGGALNQRHYFPFAAIKLAMVLP